MRKLAMMTTALLALAITGVALAGGGTIVSAYGGKGGTPVGSVVHPSPGSPTQHTGTLPFTGLDLLVFVAAALILIGLGVLLVRSNRPNRNQA